MTPRGLHALLLAAIVLGSGTTVAVQVVEVKKSYNAPGGLSRNETPQFLVFSESRAAGGWGGGRQVGGCSAIWRGRPPLPAPAPQLPPPAGARWGQHVVGRAGAAASAPQRRASAAGRSTTSR